MTVNDSCMADIALSSGGYALNCNANDVSIAGVATDENGDYLLEILDPAPDPGCAFPGDTVTFAATFDIVTTAKERHDIGIYFTNDGDPDGDGARTGMCSISTLPYKNDPPWLDLDGTTDTFPGTNDVSNLQDFCGDSTKLRNPMNPTITLTATCVDVDGNGLLDLPYCTSWRQSGANDYCDSPLDAYPGAPSKCKCDDSFNVPIEVPKAKLDISKTANPTSVSEPGGSVEFTVYFKNTGIDPENDVTVTELTDTIYDNLLGDECSASYTLTGNGGDATCTFTKSINGNSGDQHKNVVSIKGLDSRTPANELTGSDDATVDITPVPPAITVVKTASPTSIFETLAGTLVTYTVKITNTSTATSDPVQVTKIRDAVTETGGVDEVLFDPTTNSVTCKDSSGAAFDLATGWISKGDYIECTFTRTLGAASAGFSASTHTNTVKVDAVDDEGTEANNNNSATVNINDAALVTAMQLTKTASTDVSNCPVAEGEDPPATCTNLYEPGGTATFSVAVKNTGTIDAIKVTSLWDDVHGDVNGQGDCSVPQTIQPGATYSCSFQAQVTGNSGYMETDIVCADGTDDDGVPLNQACDSATVTIIDVQPTATLTKKAVSAIVKYTVTVTNTSEAESVDVTQLNDDQFGDVSSTAVDAINGPVVSSTCVLPQTLADSTVEDGSDSYQCMFEAIVTTTPHTNTVTGTVQDDENNSVTPSDSATVTIEDATAAQ